MLDEIATQTANTYKVPVSFLMAIIQVESSNNTFAVRFEPAWIYFYDVDQFAKKNAITFETEKVLQACSWGLCQIMGSVARENGFESPLQSLCQFPATNVKICCKILNNLLAKYNNNLEAVASAYNAGGANVLKLSGQYKNQDYVDRVMVARAAIMR